jgi:hypothetical protein
MAAATGIVPGRTAEVGGTDNVVVARRLRVGDTLTLPSGEVVSITTAADPARPWRAHEVSVLWGVRREQPPGQVHREPWQHYHGDKPGPLLLAQRDAFALAYALNVVAPKPGPAEPGRVREDHSTEV